MGEQRLKFDGEAMTRREILIAREASAKARCAALFAARVEGGAHLIGRSHDGFCVATNPCRECVEEAKQRYPLPKVERPRVVIGADAWFFRVVDGVLQTQNALGECCPHEIRWEAAPDTIAIADIRLLADLLANPTELVDDDDPALPSSGQAGTP